MSVELPRLAIFVGGTLCSNIFYPDVRNSPTPKMHHLTFALLFSMCRCALFWEKQLEAEEVRHGDSLVTQSIHSNHVKY